MIDPNTAQAGRLDATIEIINERLTALGIERRHHVKRAAMADIARVDAERQALELDQVELLKSQEQALKAADHPGLGYPYDHPELQSPATQRWT